MKAILGEKIGMTQMFTPEGKAVPVTVIQAGPCVVVQTKTADTDGYEAIQVSFGQIKEKNVNKPLKGHFAKAGAKVSRYLREFRVENASEYTLGQEIKADIFQVGESVDVTGTSKGKGFAGTIKRHNFKRHRKTHGGKGNTRKPGSIGSMYPQKVFKGKTMAGHMGHERVTVKNLEVAYVDPETNLIGVKGAVPGPRKGLIILGGNK